MAKTTITIRVDQDLKAKAEQACEYLGTTLTAIIHHQLHSTLDTYYKKRAYESEVQIRSCQGQIAQAAHDVLKQMIEIQRGKGNTITLKPEVEKLLFQWGIE